MKPINKIILILILIIATSLRLYRLDTLPAFNPDEAALGYNAYSLLETGKDEHGISWPLHFKSFGDFKPGGYVYLALPFIKIMGLTPLAVRLPNLILSVLTIFIVFRLIQLLSKNTNLPLITAFVLAINPWHIHFSRGAWETSAALFFIILGTYWFYQKKYLTFLIPFIVSLYIYHSARLISPLIVFFLITYHWKIVFKNIKLFIIGGIIAAFLTLPVAISFLKSGGTTRLGGVGLSADYGPIARAEELLNQHGNTELTNRIIHNKRVLYLLSWTQKYTSHFDLNFLFINGDEVPRSRSPDMGQLYLFELPLLILGLVYLAKFELSSSFGPLVIALFLITPLPSSLTFQAPSALRALALSVPLTITISCGIYYFIKITSKYFPHNIFLLTILYIYSAYYFVDAYFIHSPSRYSFAWNNGFSQVIPIVESNKNKFDNIYFTNKYDQPYILYLFFTKYPPSKIQSQIQLTPPDKFGFSTVTKIDNITFNIPTVIPPKSLVIEASDFQSTGKSFKIYIK